LLGVINKHTVIATKTKMNADYVPGMVTVLHGKDLEARGVRTMMEALNLAPGLDLVMDNTGTPGLVSRGIGTYYISGTSMVILDGTPLNTILFGDATGVCNIPIEQIERIEIIRGPGAAVHGEFAYSGVINITTRRETKRLFSAVGSENTYSGGGMVSYISNDDDFALSFNGGANSSDGVSHYAGPDYYGNYGLTNEKLQAATGFGSLRYKKFVLLANYLKEGMGNHYTLQPIAQDHLLQQHRYKTIEARQGIELTQNLDLLFKAGWQEYTFNLNELRRTPAQSAVVPPNMFYILLGQEEKTLVSLESTWVGWQGHKVLAGGSYSHVGLSDAWQEANYNPATFVPEPWQRYTGALNYIDANVRRDIGSLTLLDEFQIDSDILLTLGLRYDYYSDAGENFSPRLAVVWQPRPQHIFKAQYARAFRPPTFIELYGQVTAVIGNPGLSSEFIDTYEVGYIHRLRERVVKFTLFYSSLKDLIIASSSGPGFSPFTNNGRADQQGAELEIKERILDSLLFDGNISYAYTRDKLTNTEVMGTRGVLAN